MDISTIVDVKELKVMKADQYDELEMHNSGAAQARQNIQVINERIQRIEASKREIEEQTNDNDMAEE